MLSAPLLPTEAAITAPFARLAEVFLLDGFRKKNKKNQQPQNKKDGCARWLRNSNKSSQLCQMNLGAEM